MATLAYKYINKIEHRLFHIKDHYKDVQIIAQGGMSKVYLATDMYLNRRVALKVINVSDNASEQAIAEAKLLACFNHPNIVTIYKTLYEDDQVFIEMEYIPGRTLSKVFTEQSLSINEKLKILLDISHGLAAIHQQNILHLDLKPANVLVSDKGIVKIVDFGISQIKDLNENNKNSSFGSLTAMSPEQLKLQKVDFKSDLFSLGLIAYQLFSGHHAYSTQGLSCSDKDIAEKIKHTPWLTKNNKITDIPPALSLLINCLLSYKKKNRPNSVVAVIEQLQSIKEVMEGDSPTILMTDIQQVKKNEFSKKLAWAFSLFFVFFSLFGGGLWYWQTHKAKEYIALLPVQFSDSSDLLNAQKKVLSLGFNDAMTEHLLKNSRYALISDAEILKTKALLGKGASLALLAKALNAKELLLASLDCTLLTCDVTLSRLEGSDATLIKKVRSATDSENYINAYNTGTSLLNTLFLDSINTPLDKNLHEENDFLQRYVSLVNVAFEKSVTTKLQIHKAEILILNNPEFNPLYPLYRKVVLRYYKSSADKAAIKKLVSVLDNGAASYRNSPAYLIDLLEIYQHTNEKKKAEAIIKKIKLSSLEQYQKQTTFAIYYKRTGDLERSLLHAQQAYNIRPTLLATRNLAIAYLMLGKNQYASKYLAMVVQYTPHDFVAMQTLADISLLSGDLTTAATNYMALIDRGSANASTHSNFSIVLSLQGKYVNALEHAQKAAQLSPNNRTVQLNFADLLFITGKKEHAFAIYNAINNSAFGRAVSMEATLEQAQAQVHLGQAQEAMIKIEKLISKYPDLGEVYFVKAMIQAILSEKYSALASIEQSLNKGWSAEFYRLPWFKGLCSEDKLLVLIGKVNYQSLCAI